MANTYCAVKNANVAHAEFSLCVYHVCCMFTPCLQLYV
jgi:hypothetical protein